MKRLTASSAIVIATLAAMSLAALGAAGPAGGASHDISIVDFAFKPAELTVLTGEPVSWTNDGAETHTVTSPRGGELESGDLAPKEGYGHVFETPGVYEYHCAIHPDQMQGIITVKAAAATPTPSGSPEPTPPAGTLPPNFSPFPSVGPVATPTPAPSGTAPPSTSPSATPAASAIPSDSTGSGGGSTLPLLLLAAAAVGVALAVWWRRRATA